ncbi:hypothetical protein Mgra_00000434 [Meloidogyne graminicola]|uniref:Histone acetyltransferase n=1 Tax=Meloidogyne graminicola TaxID=189291 RepID=A0A8T0A1N7_9BILA|nr:hypothetical protein Mgra_00000434 [Meloidogyne graminicola]
MKSDIFKKAFQKFDEEKSKQEIKQEDSYFTEIRKSIAETEEENGFISLHIINNDYSPLQDRNKIKWLFDVQRLFSIQLPKMPREYVTRIVFDRTHTNLIIHKKDKGIIAGICYRLFKEQGFAEIVFCAVMADEQVKGYGTHMMNHLKDYMVGKLGIYHLLTYADEFAIGYFIKQDFITEFALPASKYKGYIKDYQGATLMYCQLHPKLIYIKSKQIYHNMRRIYTLALKEAFPNYGMQFGGLKPLFDKNGGQPLSLKQIPGTEILSNIEDLKKAEEEHEKYQQTGETLQKNFRLILQKLKEDKNSWPFKKNFLKRISRFRKVPDYKNIINFPIDLSIITQKLKDGFYTCVRSYVYCRLKTFIF